MIILFFSFGSFTWYLKNENHNPWLVNENTYAKK